MKVIGDRALLFTDIEGSTALLQRLGPAYADVLDQHHRIMRDAVRRGGGLEVQNEGDAFVVLFPAACSALAAAVEAQLELVAGPWPDGTTVAVRMGLHWGEIGRSESGYVGMPLHEAARVAAAAHGGQILLSEAARDRLVEEPVDGFAGELRVLGRFSLKDVGDDVLLVQVVHPGLADAFPPPRAGSGRRNNLPVQLTNLVARQAEAAEVGGQLRRHRLVTLCGAGGVGKTRLALSVAADNASRFEDGVWFADLSAVGSEAELVDAVREATGVADESLSVAELVDHLAGKRLLLLLDNCEHVLDAAAGFAERVMRACPHVHVLATSREPLGTTGELRWRVPSLAAPDAAALFVARARLVEPDLAPDAADLAAIERLCRRIDGIPLAVELAAARVSTIPLAEIEERLVDGLRLLGASARGGVARHQTLRATLEWSYALLDENEQRLLRALSALRQPDVDAVEAVCGAGVVDVVETVHSLHTKSLLTLDRSTAPARVRLPEIVRQFAAELVAAAGEGEQLAARHARHYLEASETTRRGCLGPDRLAWLQRFADDEGDYAVAVDWWTVHDPARAAVLLANAKEWLAATDNRAWLERLRTVSEHPGLDGASIAIVCSLRANLAGLYGRESADVASTCARRALAHLDAVDAPLDRVRALTNAALGLREADPDLAAGLASQVVEESERLGDDVEAAWALVDLNLLRHEHHPGTVALRAELLDRIERIGPAWTNVGPLVDEALSRYQVGDYDAARRRLDAAEQMLARLPRHREVWSEDAHALDVWQTLIYAELGDSGAAILLAEDRLARLADRRGLQAKQLSGPYGQALLLAGQSDAASAAFELAADRADGWRYLTYAIAMIGRGLLALDAGCPDDAEAVVADIAASNRRMWVRARAHDVLAEATLARGDVDAAAEHVAEADRLRDEGGFVTPPALRPRTEAVRRSLALYEPRPAS